MRHFLTFLTIIAAALLVTSANSQVRDARPDEAAFPIKKGFARIIDGDTMSVQDRNIRLYGIDAPERYQTCSRDGVEYWCGFEATNALRKIVRGRSVVCVVRGEDRHWRYIAICSVDGIDIGREMVRRGWAVAYTRYSKDYIAAAAAAKAGGLGVWRGDFTMPWVWRNKERRK